MKPDTPQTPRDELEARITALILGELTSQEAVEVRQAMEHDAELARLHQRLKRTLDFIRDAAANPSSQTAVPPPDLKLSPERRQRLLEQFKGVTPRKPAKPHHRELPWYVPMSLAAGLIGLLAVVGLLGNFWANRRPSAWNRADLELGRRFDAFERSAAVGDKLDSSGRTAGRLALGVPLESDEMRRRRRVAEGLASQKESQSAGPAPEPSATVLKQEFKPPSPGEPATRIKSRPSSGPAGPDVNRALANVPALALKPAVEAGAPAETHGVSAPAGRRSPDRQLVEGPPAVPAKPERSGALNGIYLPPSATTSDGTDLYAFTDESTKDFLSAKPTPGYGGGGGGYGGGGYGGVQGDARGFGAVKSRDSKGEGQALRQLQSLDGAAAGAVGEDKAWNYSEQLKEYNGRIEDKKTAGLKTPTVTPPPTLTPPMNARVAVDELAQLAPKTAQSAQSDAVSDRSSHSAGQTSLGYFMAGTGTAAAKPEQRVQEARLADAQPAYGFGRVGGNGQQHFFSEGDISGKHLEEAPQLVAGDAIHNRAGVEEQLKSIEAGKVAGSDKPTVPVLGDVPVLGGLFRAETRSSPAGSKTGAMPAAKARTTPVAEGAPKDNRLGLRDNEVALAENLVRKAAEADSKPVEADLSLEVPQGGGTPQSEVAKKSETESEGQTAAKGKEPMTRGLAAIELPQIREKAQAQVGEVAQRQYGISAENRPVTAPAAPAAPTPTSPPPAPAVPVEDGRVVNRLAALPEPQPEILTRNNPFSTFSLNVSDVSFKLAASSLESGVMPDPATVRSEEFINAFDYRDPEPAPGQPIAFVWDRVRYPFAHNRDLVRFSIKTAARGREPGRPLNLVLLLDNSGSMERADRVQIIRECLRVLATQLQPADRISVVAFARTARLWVDGMPGSQAGELVDRVGNLTPQGGTNLEEAMNLAYQTAVRHYLNLGINRVVLLTDGAANLGDVKPESLKHKVELHRQQGIALDCFGIGWEGYNDDLLEVLSRHGDGRYGFVNTPAEAAAEFAGQLAGALQVAAADVKVQVEFNPKRVSAYRQIGYAKHQLTKEQFRDNAVDAAEIGAAESGNALYTLQVEPRGEGPIGLVRVRYMQPDTGQYYEHEWRLDYTGGAVALERANPAMRLAASASAFSEWLLSSPFAAEVTPDLLLSCMNGVPEVYQPDARPTKLEWMIRQAKAITGR